MEYIQFLAIFSILITYLQPNSFAQENKPKANYVKELYFRPNDRPAKKNINDDIDKLMKHAQKFYANNMENHGFGRKTFELETDKNGKTIVHHIIGDDNYEFYKKDEQEILIFFDKIKNTDPYPSSIYRRARNWTMRTGIRTTRTCQRQRLLF